MNAYPDVRAELRGVDIGTEPWAPEDAWIRGCSPHWGTASHQDPLASLST